MSNARYGAAKDANSLALRVLQRYSALEIIAARLVNDGRQHLLVDLIGGVPQPPQAWKLLPEPRANVEAAALTLGVAGAAGLPTIAEGIPAGVGLLSVTALMGLATPFISARLEKKNNELISRLHTEVTDEGARLARPRVTFPLRHTVPDEELFRRLHAGAAQDLGKVNQILSQHPVLLGGATECGTRLRNVPDSIKHVAGYVASYAGFHRPPVGEAEINRAKGPVEVHSCDEIVRRAVALCATRRATQMLDDGNEVSSGRSGNVAAKLLNLYSPLIYPPDVKRFTAFIDAQAKSVIDWAVKDGATDTEAIHDVIAKWDEAAEVSFEAAKPVWAVNGMATAPEFVAMKSAWFAFRVGAITDLGRNEMQSIELPQAEPAAIAELQRSL